MPSPTSPTGPEPRVRWRVALWIPLVVAAGLGTRAGLPLPALVRVYGGDTLYAVLMFVLLALIWPTASSRKLSQWAAIVCVLIELSQLWHPPWLDAIRATRPGALVLGQGFVWTDLVCYLVGANAAGLIDQRLRRRSVMTS